MEESPPFAFDTHIFSINLKVVAIKIVSLMQDEHPLQHGTASCHNSLYCTVLHSKCFHQTHLNTGLVQGWANSGPRAICGPLRVFLWPAKTVRKIRLELRFPSRERPKIRLIFSTTWYEISTINILNKTATILFNLYLLIL
jgi:hypothetical protein